MKVFQINIFGNLSTGRIAVDLYRMLKESGNEGMVAFARNTIEEDIPHVKIGNKYNVYLDALMTRLTDRAGFFSNSATRKLIKEIDKYNPDIIHLHNLHGYYINIEILFEYLKKIKKPIVWTLHDCWAFTGHCCYYSMVDCNKWKTGCYECEQHKAYPASFVDNSKRNYSIKRELFSSLPNLTLVPVSYWLEKEIKASFLNRLPTRVIYNGVDTTLFKPTHSNFRAEYNLMECYIILGVASTWDTRKGLNDFIQLSAMLSNEYRIVLVGISEKEKRILPENIIPIERTNSISELAGLYSEADIFFNASVEETFGLPTVEAIACGTPAIVYDCTALPETISFETGYVVQPHDLEAVKKIIESRPEKHRRIEKQFEKQTCYSQYIELYRNLIGDKV